VEIVAGAAFIVATLVLYWSGWDTLWRLGICLVVGLLLFLVYAGRKRAGKLDLREAAWLLPYLVGIGVISALGSFGGAGLVPFGWDMAIIVLFSLAIFRLALRCRLPQEKLDRYLAAEGVIEQADSQ
jgi:hypothetical protein